MKYRVLGFVMLSFAGGLQASDNKQNGDDDTQDFFSRMGISLAPGITYEQIPQVLDAAKGQFIWSSEMTHETVTNPHLSKMVDVIRLLDDRLTASQKETSELWQRVNRLEQKLQRRADESKANKLSTPKKKKKQS